MISPLDMRTELDLVDVANDYLGKTCFVWPYNREYQIENVNNNDCSYRVNVSAPFFFDDKQVNILICFVFCFLFFYFIFLLFMICFLSRVIFLSHSPVIQI
jgi:hypothetical protein